MPFRATFETRHTDTYAATPFVHQGVLLAFTELAYARLEEHLGIAKPEHIICAQREILSRFARPLHWRENAVVEMHTTEVSDRGFSQEIAIRSAENDGLIATFIVQWAWLDTKEGRRIDLTSELQAQYASI